MFDLRPLARKGRVMSGAASSTYTLDAALPALLAWTPRSLTVDRVEPGRVAVVEPELIPSPLTITGRSFGVGHKR